MTIEENLIEMLVNDGMDDAQAKQVMERVKADKINDAMWSHDIEDYPESLLDLLWLSTKGHALEWIDANLPLAWFRPMFASD